jgi:hypothetical protein
LYFTNTAPAACLASTPVSNDRTDSPICFSTFTAFTIFFLQKLQRVAVSALHKIQPESKPGRRTACQPAPEARENKQQHLTKGDHFARLNKGRLKDSSQQKNPTNDRRISII